jgi:hypothetical protein
MDTRAAGGIRNAGGGIATRLSPEGELNRAEV